LEGEVHNESTDRIFSTGAILGESDIHFKRDRIENYIALTKVYALKFEKDVF
jgi:hypothetical protein